MELLLVILVVLKVIGLLSWPWWAVLIPLWIGLAGYALGGILFVVGATMLRRPR